MKTIHFNTVVGLDQVIRPPAGVLLPAGEIAVVVTPHETQPANPTQRPGPGLFKGSITYMAPDFDAPLDDLREYMD